MNRHYQIFLNKWANGDIRINEEIWNISLLSPAYEFNPKHKSIRNIRKKYILDTTGLSNLCVKDGRVFASDVTFYIGGKVGGILIWDNNYLVCYITEVKCGTSIGNLVRIGKRITNLFKKPLKVQQEVELRWDREKGIFGLA
jgi:hypothetical protein